jgi:hypothetical protein
MGRILDYFTNKWPYTDFHELNADWLITSWKELTLEVDKLDTWKATHEEEYQELKALYDELLAGNYPDTFIDSLKTWIQKNIFDIVGEYIKFITVALNDDGYIVIRYPSHWNQIVFNTTGYDINTDRQPEYGHLTISY